MSITICYSRCYQCMYGFCYDPPQWHSWADPEDEDHRHAIGESTSPGRCACACANTPAMEDAR